MKLGIASTHFLIILLCHLVSTSTWARRCSESPSDASFPEDGLCSCGDDGNISELSIRDCEALPCSLSRGQDLRVEYTFISYKALSGLNLAVNVISDEGVIENLWSLRGIQKIEAGKAYPSSLRLTVNATLPPGKKWEMEILRHYDDSRICARFPVLIDYVEVPTTPEPTTVLPPSFECPDLGYHADPSDCQKFHICQRFPNGTWWDSEMSCGPATVWCQRILTCDHAWSCPCELRN